MIENTLLHFKTKAAFNTELEAGNIKDDSIVFIDESKEIWTHGTYYNCSELDLSNIATKEELALKLDETTADSNYWKRTETVNQAVSSEFASSAYADDEDNRISTTYATKIEVEGKQDVISDIEVIRSGAAKGATALQSYTEKYTGTITGVTMNGASKGTSGVVDLGTVITSHLDISGKLDVTIAAETYAKKAEAVISNGTVTSVIAMTQAEYDALTTKNATTLYIITS